jgi:hypothetical protein
LLETSRDAAGADDVKDTQLSKILVCHDAIGIRLIARRNPNSTRFDHAFRTLELLNRAQFEGDKFWQVEKRFTSSFPRRGKIRRGFGNIYVAERRRLIERSSPHAPRLPGSR